LIDFISAPPEFDERTPPAEKPKSLQGLTGEVLRWLRMPQNDVLYKECLALKSITLVGYFHFLLDLLKN
jgi:hypothetical protein